MVLGTGDTTCRQAAETIQCTRKIGIQLRGRVSNMAGAPGARYRLRNRELSEERNMGSPRSSLYRAPAEQPTASPPKPTSPVPFIAPRGATFAARKVARFLPWPAYRLAGDGRGTFRFATSASIRGCSRAATWRRVNPTWMAGGTPRRWTNCAPGFTAPTCRRGSAGGRRAGLHWKAASSTASGGRRPRGRPSTLRPRQ